MSPFLVGSRQFDTAEEASAWARFCVQRGRMGAHAVHSRGRTNTGPARAAREQKFYDQVDPDGVLPPDEREKRVAHLKSLHYSQMARKRWAK